MAKRRLTRQQQRRIAESQKDRLEKGRQEKGRQDKGLPDNPAYQLDENSTQPAIVVSHHGKELLAETESGERLKCRIRQNLGDIACGDRVLLQTIIENTDPGHLEPSSESQHVVTAVEERDNLLTRTGFGGSIKAIAANISQLVIVAAVQPKPNPYLIDRYIAAAENLPARCLLVLNKTDLIAPNDSDSDSDNNNGDGKDDNSRELENELKNLVQMYSQIGYTVIQTSVKQASGIDALQEQLQGNTSILVGLSGVGKSSLVKMILPEQEIRIGDTSVATGEGKHTTTVSALYHLQGNGIIIDSPGVRDFSPTFTTVEEITHGFRDVYAFSTRCKFSNCQHGNEPGCALNAAVASGDINKLRADNYRRLVSELEQA